MAIADNYLSLRNAPAASIHDLASGVSLGRYGALILGVLLIAVGTALWVHLAMTGNTVSVFIRAAAATVLFAGGFALIENHRGRSRDK